MPRIAVVPGSFDPVTVGHLDVIAKAARLFDEVRVVVVHNPGKAALFPADRRVALIRTALADAGIRGPEVDLLDSGLLVDYCRRAGAGVIVKGLRSNADLAYETPMAIVNRDLAGVETVFVPSDPGTSHVSSSLVRQVAALGGDVSRYVPQAVVDAIAEVGDR